ncbi:MULTISPECIES: FAD:protein FMN transferase [Acidobacterium]|uniref:FAD:protein FMN transferase n=1 Tax=Acidobacterium capsulatum (strain ATCC 51196 / DSM 11244 / BCRC 80197 / JCM 7670 / NBRC 15755 / NCIMB 13165 / 161) TaxID=240015 RepID=C1F5A2_ACIC5|nr:MULTISPECIES: FAD:protein FMN transferase [Acidobacterium]ACO33426.1 ApbE family protein [Acidobacterium capsulatum ATCC 51196]HCT59566.1 FAD:protein FMN transferase [Acidobacterium sp.]
MKLCSSLPVTERAQPWLGTLASIRIEGVPADEAHQAMDAAFAEIAAVHERMSFHSPESDVSRLNREAARGAVSVHSLTYSVLECAQECARRSQGCFDISVAAELVSRGVLPSPQQAARPEGGSWRDIELLPDGRVYFHRPLWIDLGGIAKGFAVDRASECLAGFGIAHSVVNAGGDIRLRGMEAEIIRLSAPSDEGMAPVLELAQGSVAGSCAAPRDGAGEDLSRSVHFHGSGLRPAPPGRFVCVIAEHCMTADALTKVVMAQGEDSAGLLLEYEAAAWIKDPGRHWQHLGIEIA